MLVALDLGVIGVKIVYLCCEQIVAFVIDSFV